MIRIPCKDSQFDIRSKLLDAHVAYDNPIGFENFLKREYLIVMDLESTDLIFQSEYDYISFLLRLG